MPRPRSRRAPPRQPNLAPESEDAPEPYEADDDTPFEDASWLMSDSQAEKRVKEQEERQANRVREFYVSSRDVQESANGSVEVRTHTVVNLAKREGDNYINVISAPRVQIPEGKGFRIYTSPDNGDCAFREAGMNPGIRPCFLILDHRKYITRDGRRFQDDIKQFNPAGKCIAMMKAAIRDLCENLDVDPDDPEAVNKNVDTRDHVLKITKLGTGKGSGWSLSFVTKKAPLTEEHTKKIKNFFGTDDMPSRKEYLAKMRKILAPDPKYLISRGGKYVKPTTDKNAGGSDDEVPF